jgi:hypothetical protein
VIRLEGVNGNTLTDKQEISDIISITVRLLLTVGLEVLTAASTNMGVFWVAAPCSLVEVF